VRSWQIAVSAAANSASSGLMPLAPEPSRLTVSLVDMQPSESRRSKVIRVAVRSAVSSWAESRTASVVMTTSIVASPGASIPAPLAIPPIDQPAGAVTADCFGVVSVVMMARAAERPASADVESSFCRARVASQMPAVILSRSSCSPIRPVEQTMTSPAETPRRSPTASAVAWVVWKPMLPV